MDYVTERCHRTFRWWYDYSGGPITDWGAHHNDIARWAIGLDGPIAIEARVHHPADPRRLHTPSEYEVTLTWANGVKQIVKNHDGDDSPFGGGGERGRPAQRHQVRGHRRLDLGEPRRNHRQRQGNRS